MKLNERRTHYKFYDQLNQYNNVKIDVLLRNTIIAFLLKSLINKLNL
jgi:hypothetical protein